MTKLSEVIAEIGQCIEAENDVEDRTARVSITRVRGATVKKTA